MATTPNSNMDGSSGTTTSSRTSSRLRDLDLLNRLGYGFSNQEGWMATWNKPISQTTQGMINRQSYLDNKQGIAVDYWTPDKRNITLPPPPPTSSSASGDGSYYPSYYGGYGGGGGGGGGGGQNDWAKDWLAAWRFGKG